MMLAVVRLPMAQSVPSTAITGQVTSAIRPLNRCKSFLSRGLRTSRILTLLAIHAAANTGSSFKNSCRPLTIFIPWLIASSTRPRSCFDSMPLDGAIPKMKKSGTEPACDKASARSRQMGIAFGLLSRIIPVSRPAFSLSITDRILYFSERLIRPLAVLPSISPKLASQ